jgi:hypothetical protein
VGRGAVMEEEVMEGGATEEEDSAEGEKEVEGDLEAAAMEVAATEAVATEAAATAAAATEEVGAKEADLACNNSPSPYFLDQYNLEHSRNYLVESILDLLSSLNRRRSRPRTLEVLYHYC